MNQCACCGKRTADEPCVNCCVCKKVFLPTCVDLSRAEVRRINSNKGLFWTCKNCVSFGNDLEALKSVIYSLQQDVKNLKSAQELANGNAHANPLLATEEIIQEIQDRNRRRNNIIVHGVVEGEFPSKEQQVEADRTVLSGVFEAVGVNVGDYRVARLGRYDPDRVGSKRPIKVTFGEEGVARAVLRKTGVLKQTEAFSRIFIANDKTPFQSELYKSVKQELDLRIANGENNLRIKYKNGLPQITALN